MKKTMKQYFERFCNMWMGFNGTYPQISYDVDNDSRLYVGTIDEEEYISWKPLEKNAITELNHLETKYGVKFNECIVEYFNSYWFFELMGFCGEHNVSLMPVIPLKETAEFEMRLRDYYEVLGKIDYVPIGFDATTYNLIVIENESGKVFLHDTETEKKTFFFSSLKEMISNISFKRI